MKKAVIPKPAAESTSRSKTLLAASSAEMEAELLRRCIRRTDDEILRVLGVLDAMRAKQINRQHELVRIRARLAVNTVLSENGH